MRDKTRPPGIPPVPQAKVHAVDERTLRAPPGAVTHWTGRAMAEAMGLSLRTIQRIWAAHKLQPHRIRTFGTFNPRIGSGGSTEPEFATKLNDVVGLYKHPEVSAWLAERPRWTFHFTPTSCSWLNAVEGFFSGLTRRSLKRGVFRSEEDLETTITRYIDAATRMPKPFVWTATATAIRTKLALNYPSESVHEH